ncbi:archaetidylserine decarboxylase [Alkalicoccus urumqiensis]|uniref:phosphatidylserine decarboxylase n=1 Tax=Alkalicoccus urumqiensis TaxID=1548213 RepID=A0A2P6MFM5_ALKUR|nr:archaetidylserine decarboxylase [Alkalicoccus urumqiensis]PRO65067.1 phosphatidylserine decarboxylase [Alkalicoccus urumqiensis]
MKKTTYQLLMDLTHQPLYTAILKRSAASPLSRWLIPSFAKTYQIPLAEAEKPWRDYASLQEFFSRRLHEPRPVTGISQACASPVDGAVTAVGTLDEDVQFSVKGKVHDIQTLLSVSDSVSRYSGGAFIVLYLAPSDYHRIHAPLTGSVVRRYALGEYSEPVNDLGLRFGIQPLASNYRLITELETAAGRCAVVKVGALNVNTVEYTHMEDSLVKGGEFARFAFGSTVILLFEPERMSWKVNEGDHVKQGETIGHFSKKPGENRN